MTDDEPAATGEIGQWVVTTDHDYYAAVEYFRTREEAEQALCQILTDDETVSGRRGDHYGPMPPRVTMAHIVISEPLAFKSPAQAASESSE